MHLFTLFASVLALSGIEIAGTAAVTNWARTGNPMSCVVGIYLFAMLGLILGVSVRLTQHMNTVNALWQSISIVGVTILSSGYFQEEITLRQYLGVFLACCASICFV